MAKPSLKTGSVIDGFTIGERIHKGGMASLWSVTHPDIALPLLMKIPVLFEGEDPAAIVSFEMEQMIMPKLTSPHVPKFIANGDFAVQPYIVMERLSGPSLLPRLENLPVPPEEVASLGRKIAMALDNLHHQKLVHLDIKPSNIIIKPDGEVAIIDFGLSRHHDLPDLMAEEFRLPYGTAPYMAPEQVLGIRNDPRSDIFSLGVLMYFFATNVRPFGDPQKLKGLKQRLWRDPIPPRKINPNIPPWFQEITMACLEVNAARRPQTAAGLAFDLANFTQLEITDRGKKLKRDSFFNVLKRKSEPALSLIDVPAETSEPIQKGPIMLVAIDLRESYAELSHEIFLTVTHLLENSPYARIALLNILKTARVTIDRSLDAQGHNKHVQRLVLLKDWARNLNSTSGKITYHVIEAVDPADAVLEFARVNQVDHIIMGARANSTMRKLLGSVSGRVAAEAPCTVTVVRNRLEGPKDSIESPPT